MLPLKQGGREGDDLSYTLKHCDKKAFSSVAQHLSSSAKHAQSTIGVTKTFAAHMVVSLRYLDNVVVNNVRG